MDNELQKQIASVLQKAVEAAQKGGEWIAGQIPDVLHQLLVWTIAEGIAAVFVIVVQALAWVIFIPRHWRWVQDGDSYGDREFTFVPVGITAFMSFLSCLWLADFVLDGLKAAIAPKLFLLEYAAHLLK